MADRDCRCERCRGWFVALDLVSVGWNGAPIWWCQPCATNNAWPGALPDA